MYRKIFLLFLTVSVLLLCSCARTDATPAQVLDALIDAEIGTTSVSSRLFTKLVISPSALSKERKNDKINYELDCEKS